MSNLLSKNILSTFRASVRASMSMILSLMLSMTANANTNSLSKRNNFNKPTTYQFSYNVTLPKRSTSKNKTHFFKLWIPYPTENQFQKVKLIKALSKYKWKLTTGKKYKNKMIFINGILNKSATKLSFTYQIARFVQITSKKKVENASKFLLPSKMVPLSKTITVMANKIGNGEHSPSKLIQKYYQYVVKSMSYDKSGSGWGNGDAVWACGSKRGNCTDFHSLLIGLARVKKIPARFSIGFPVHHQKMESDIPGYHCWANLYDKNKGWIPVDASESNKAGDTFKYFGHLPSDRIMFSSGRDLILSPRQSGSPLNYFIYPYFEVNGKINSKIKKDFHYKIIL